MAIRQVISRTIKDGVIADADLSNSLTIGGGYFQGETNAGSPTTGKGHIFRVHEETLNTSVTIASGDNALAAGPLTVSTSGTVELKVLGNLTIV